MNDINQYGKWTEELWFSGDGKTPTQERDLPIMSLGLGGEAGEVQEHIKKLIRDGNLDKDALKKELGDVIYYWARICRYFDITPSDVLQTNIEKIESRKARGVQRGNGDNR